MARWRRTRRGGGEREGGGRREGRGRGRRELERLDDEAEDDAAADENDGGRACA